MVPFFLPFNGVLLVLVGGASVGLDEEPYATLALCFVKFVAAAAAAAMPRASGPTKIT